MVIVSVSNNQTASFHKRSKRHSFQMIAVSMCFLLSTLPVADAFFVTTARERASTLRCPTTFAQGNQQHHHQQQGRTTMTLSASNGEKLDEPNNLYKTIASADPNGVASTLKKKQKSSDHPENETYPTANNGDDNNHQNPEAMISDIPTEKEKQQEEDSPSPSFFPAVNQAQQERDEFYMRMALEQAKLGANDTFPKPNVGAVLVLHRQDNDDLESHIIGRGFSNYQHDAIVSCLESTGLDCVPLAEWCVTWPYSSSHQPVPQQEDMVHSTLYVTLEPSAIREGTVRPALTDLIAAVGIGRIVIGCPDPIASRATVGAKLLHQQGLTVSLGSVLADDCRDLIRDYAALANSKLHRMSRQQMRLFQRPLGFLHCSVVESNNVEAFARHGNAFGTNFGGQQLGFRDFGSYEMAPPPEVIWADDGELEEDLWSEDVVDTVDFDEEEESVDIMPVGSPMMPWYEQVDAVVATFPRPGNGPPEDDSLAGRLNGLKWLATHGEDLPKNVERILVMDATDLFYLPLDNSHPDVPDNVDVEAFWKSQGRKATRVLLRRGENERARAAAQAAALAAQAAADAAKATADAIESGDAARAAQVARECQQSAQSERDFLQDELSKTVAIKKKLEGFGVLVETIEGGEPVDVMNYLGKRNAYHTVVWRAGCWSERGVRAILAGAFQWVSAHLAVDATGGRFWQLMLAENAVQAAVGPLQKVKIFADHDDLSMEYCDRPDADDDCSMSIDGRPVRHVRLDCRVALVDQTRKREVILDKTRPFDRQIVEEQAPWFL